MARITKEKVLEKARDALNEAYPLLIAAQNEAAKSKPDIKKLEEITGDISDSVYGAWEVLNYFAKLNDRLAEANPELEKES